MTREKRMPGWLHKSTVALQNPKQFPERLSFISLFIFVAFATAESCLEKERKFVQKRQTRIVMFLGIMALPFLVVLSHFYPPCVTYFLFFTLRVTHCRVESKFLTLKISCKGTTKLLETDGGTEVDHIEGSMTQRIEKIEREREREGRKGERGRKVRSEQEREEKKIAGWKEGLHRGFWFSRFIWTKADFPIFRLSAGKNRHSN